MRKEGSGGAGNYAKMPLCFPRTPYLRSGEEGEEGEESENLVCGSGQYGGVAFWVVVGQHLGGYSSHIPTALTLDTPQ